MEKLDLKQALGAYWKAPIGDFVIVELPPCRFAMVDGEGDPNVAPAYAEALGALYAVSYKLKFLSKAAGRDYVVGPLQGLWWADDMGDFAARRKANWRWTMMIMQPDWITPTQFDAAVDAVRGKNGPLPPTLRFETLAEGQCVQTLHIGPYDAEGPILRRLHEDFLPANGLVPRGRHHEIYLSDPRRVAPEKLKTILRQPVGPRG